MELYTYNQIGLSQPGIQQIPPPKATQFILFSISNKSDIMQQLIAIKTSDNTPLKTGVLYGEP